MPDLFDNIPQVMLGHFIHDTSPIVDDLNDLIDTWMDQVDQLPSESAAFIKTLIGFQTTQRDFSQLAHTSTKNRETIRSTIYAAVRRIAQQEATRPHSAVTEAVQQYQRWTSWPASIHRP